VRKEKPYISNRLPKYVYKSKAKPIGIKI